MKNLKFLSFMLLAMLSVGLVSCGDDDEIGGRNELVGTWQCVWTEGYLNFANHPEDNETWNEAENYFIVFNEDGTVESDGEYGQWKLEGDKLTTSFPYDGDDTYTILKLTDSEMIVEIYGKDNTSEYYEKSTLQKR